MRTHLLGVAAVAAFAAALGAADWTQFRGPGSDAVSSEKDLPLKWGKDEGIRYKVELKGRGLSNPVIAGGKIYLTACTGFRERRLHVLCLDEKTGKKLWERQFTATGSTSCHQVSTMAAPTPVTDGKAVYALFATGDVMAIDGDGDLLWYRSLVGDYPSITNQVGMASSPVLVGDVLCVPMDNAGDSFAAGLDRKTGKNVWKVKRDKVINWVTPLPLEFGGKAAVLYQGAGGASIYDAASGAELWSYKGSTSTIPSPAKGNGMVFLTGEEVTAVTPKAGEKTGKAIWTTKWAGNEYASPVYHDGKLYGLTAAALICMDAKDGEELWRLRVDGNFDGSPVIANGHLYAVTRKGRTYVVSLADKGKVVARNELDDTIQATPAIANGCVYLRSDKYLYCIGPQKK